MRVKERLNGLPADSNFCRQTLLSQYENAIVCVTALEAAVDEFPRAAGGVLLALLDCVKCLLVKLIREV